MADNPVDNRTLGMGIKALAHHGVLLERMAGDKPYLPGNIVMVPKDVWAVLTAGDKATVAFEEGPHELDLTMFNRGPSGIFYLVDQDRHEAVWSAPGGQNSLNVTIRCRDPIRMVQAVVLDRELESDQELWSLVFKLVGEAAHAELPPTEARKNLEAALADLGLELLSLAPATKEKATVQIRKNPMPTPRAAAGTNGILELTHVLASSTMDLFGKGELTLMVRLRAALTPQQANQGDFVYDRTLRFESPENWLRPDDWQPLPEGSIRFDGLGQGWVAVLELLGEERDTLSSDTLGAVTTPLTMQPGEFELGPTQGGKGGHFIRVKGRYKIPSPQ